MDQELVVKMRKLAESSPRKEELLHRATQLESALVNFDVPNVLGAWARARKLYCEITGENLV